MPNDAKPTPNMWQVHDRVDSDVKELARECSSARELSAKVSGSSEETAALFNSGRTLARDGTGPRDP